MWVPKIETDGKRRYRQWSGNPVGTAEDTTRCVVSVADGGRSPLAHQCYRKRGCGPDGLYCMQHFKKLPVTSARCEESK
jgi:adenylyl- and sulfurtransferase ThiI